MKYLTCAVVFLALCLNTNNFNTEATISSPAVASVVPTSVTTGMDPMVFENSLQTLYSTFGLAKYDLSFEAFRYGMIGYYNMLSEGKLKNSRLFTIIDFSKPSTAKRFFTLDMESKTIKYHTYVSHGRNTGENMATAFSNKVHSNQSSLGFFVTGETYVGSKGYSLKLDGLEPGVNDNVRKRAVVIHNADYVSENWIKKYGRLGRSQGCPALPVELSKEIIDSIKDKSAIFAYFEDENYISASRYLDLTKVLASEVIAGL